MKPDYELELLRERRLRPARRRDWAVNGYAAMEFQLGFFVLHSRSLFFSRFSFRSPISERPQVNEEHRDGAGDAGARRRIGKGKKKRRERKSTKTGKSRYACALFYKGEVCNDEMKIIMVSFVSVWSAFVRKGQNK